MIALLFCDRSTLVILSHADGDTERTVFDRMRFIIDWTENIFMPYWETTVHEIEVDALGGTDTLFYGGN